MLRFIELTCGYVPVVMQQSMEVPQTPLHTSRVLKEEKDVWEEVKVIFPSPPAITEQFWCLMEVSLTSRSPL